MPLCGHGSNGDALGARGWTWAGGHGSHRGSSSPVTPRQSGFLCPLPREKPPSLTATVEHFLAGLRLSGAEEVRAALARELAVAFTEAPAYARGKIAAELRAVVVELEASELEESNAPWLLRRVDGG
jgi:hypothetical protein